MHPGHGDVVSSSTDDDSPDELDRGFFGQPRPLANLFGVEMWERFSFYGMQGILLIYLYYSVDQGGLGIDKATATGIVGAYGGTVYLATILGAWVADRVIGPERTLFYAASVVMLGHVALAVIPDLAGVGVGLLPGRARQRRRQGQRDLAGRLALPRGRRAPRRRLLALLHGHQHRCVRRAAADRLVPGEQGLPLGLRAGRRRHVPRAACSTRSAASGCRTRAASCPTRSSRPSGIRYAGALVGFVVVLAVLVALGWMDAGNLSDWVIWVTVVASVGYFAGDAHQPAGVVRRAQPGVVVRPDVHHQRGVLVALPAAVHGGHDLLATSGWTATSSAGRCRCRGCSRSTRSSSSPWRRCSPPCGPGSGRGSRRRR